MQPLWYRNAVIYQVDVAYFLDADGDGWDDLRGLTERFEHIRGLGATCIWLLPFYASPFGDGGYDVTDHLAVDPKFGDLADFAILLNKAESLGLAGDHRPGAPAHLDPAPLVPGGAAGRSSPYRDHHVWADEPHGTGVEPVFPTVEDSVWAWDEVAQQYYRHTFYRCEPDLALGNPRARGDRPDHGVLAPDGRVRVPRRRGALHTVERAGNADPRENGHGLLEEMRDFAVLHQPEAVLLGEVDVPPEEYAAYFGSGKRLSMVLDFWLNNNLFLALARTEGQPLAEALARQPDPPRHGQYGIFLRNHDELDLEQLNDDQRAEVLDRFAPDDDMRAFGRGIRRRIAPMLDGDTRRVAMAHALLMSLPGAPVLLYGDEIGMGEDLSWPGRKAVRTPMQWSGARNAGFSLADPEALITPPISDGTFGFESINVAAQRQDRESLLAHVGNLTGQDLTCELTGTDLTGLADILCDRKYPPPAEQPTKFEPAGCGFRWLRPRDEPFSRSLRPEGS